QLVEIDGGGEVGGCGLICVIKDLVGLWVEFILESGFFIVIDFLDEMACEFGGGVLGFMRNVRLVWSSEKGIRLLRNFDGVCIFDNCVEW
ncbi:hypothetical protein, partial [Bacillus altitudinis]|uniref:hypothetical protein n=1 Tax=Bacillus altitudinis TaxID=293387 RepID=UPI001C930CF1